MRDGPDGKALLEIVAETLRMTILPKLDGAEAYQARIAANLVRIVAREWPRAAADDAAELARLRALLGRDDGDLRALNRDLAERIAREALKLEQPEVAAHLWQTTLAKLAADQPDFARLKQLGLDRSLAHDTLDSKGE